MSRIFIPSTSAEDWRMFLADPDKQWKTGYSAKSLAHCWENADGFPDKIANLIGRSPYARFKNVQMLLAFPEWEVPLAGGRQGSMSDVFVLAHDAEEQLISITIEGKVAEPFGPTIEEWEPSSTPGKTERLAHIQEQLGLDGDIPGHIRYQLLHRTASAMIEARRFNAQSAVMIVHSFSQTDEWFEDYQQSVELFGIEDCTKELARLNKVDGIELYSGWAVGDAAYLKA